MLVLGAMSVFSTNAFAQRSAAHPGEPFGVGVIEMAISRQDLPPMLGAEGIQIVERRGRVFYPAIQVDQIPEMVTNILKQSRRPLGRLIGDILEEQVQPNVKVFFLFQGDAPLEIQVTTRRPRSFTLRPSPDAGGFETLRSRWWEAYADPRGLNLTEDYPPLVENYLHTLLAWRLGMPLSEKDPPKWRTLLLHHMGFDLDPAGFVLRAQQERFMGPPATQNRATLPTPPSLAERLGRGENSLTQFLKTLPEAEVLETSPANASSSQDASKKSQKGSLWGSLSSTFSKMTTQGKGTSRDDSANADESSEAAPVPQIAGIETMALHVPENCFYVRFGNFQNFLWVQDTIERWGGDLQNLIALRGIDYRSSEQMERQLALEQNAISRMFGNSVIGDVALIGTDTYLQDGGSYGLIFQAKNNALLASDFQRQRNTALKETDGAEERTLQMGDREVSFLSTPDNTLRSYYVQVGDFHLVSRSETLVRLFLAVHAQPDAAGQESAAKLRSLGELEEFQVVREILPKERPDTIFAYFSRPYLFQLLSPDYWIETRRRTQAIADTNLLMLGRLAGKSEGRPHKNMEDLIEAGLLPEDFPHRPDGGRPVFTESGHAYDSLRGFRGDFLPAADHLPEKISPEEQRAYDAFCRRFADQWSNLDPIVLALGRSRVNADLERVDIDARIAPLSKKNFQQLQSMVGAPDRRKLASIPQAIAQFEAILSDQRLFGGLWSRPVGSRSDQRERELAESMTFAALLKGNLMPRDLLPGYWGVYGSSGGASSPSRQPAKPSGMLRLLDFGFRQSPDPQGYSRGLFGSWRRYYGDFTLYSGHRSILETVSPQLQFVEQDFASQIRAQVGDLSDSDVMPMVNNLAYARTRETSRGNLILMKQLGQQLHVAGPQQKEIAEMLLDGTLICPLGGTYRYQQDAPGRGRWISTALRDAPSGSLFSTVAPRGFVAPPLNWFRGLKMQTLVASDAVSIHAEVDMHMTEKTPVPAARNRDP